MGEQKTKEVNWGHWALLGLIFGLLRHQIGPWTPSGAKIVALPFACALLYFASRFILLLQGPLQQVISSIQFN